MSKREMKDYLIASKYATKEVVERMKIAALRHAMVVQHEHVAEQLNRGTEGLNALDEAVPDEENDIAVETSDSNGRDLKPSNPGWAQHVMGQFQPDELQEGNPKVDGLRRVAEALLGTIIREDCELISSPSMENNMMACAKATFVFQDENGSVFSFSSLADACGANLTPEFKMYITAMADTRAKARALRNALRLRSSVAAEELGGSIGLMNAKD
jgi:hypothetical protein